MELLGMQLARELGQELGRPNLVSFVISLTL